MHLRIQAALKQGWSTPEEPTRSRLDEWFLPGCQQAPRQRAAPFFLEVHDELTKSWRNPYSACLRTSTSTTLTIIDCSEEKDYEKLLLLDEAMAAHLCPPTSIGRKAIRPSPVGPLQLSLDVPTPRLDKQVPPFTQ